MSLLNLLDLVALQRNDLLTGLVEDYTQFSPEISKFPVVTRAGTWYTFARRTALPSVGFRQANNGSTGSKSTYRQELREMFFLDGIIDIDEAITKANDGSTGDVLQNEVNGVLQSAFNYLGQQIWYGKDQDTNGFAGIRAQLSGVVNVGGTTNTTSAYLVWLHPQGVNIDVGQAGAIACPPPIRQMVAVASPGSGNAFHWVTNLSCYVGLSVKSQYSAWALTGANGTVSNSKYSNPISDFNATQLINKIPVTRRNGLVWFMNKTGQATLIGNRTAINNQPAGSDGGPAYSPLADRLGGFPIIVSESILDTESN
jgi:hypothetical protein